MALYFEGNRSYDAWRERGEPFGGEAEEQPARCIFCGAEAELIGEEPPCDCEPCAGACEHRECAAVKGVQ